MTTSERTPADMRRLLRDGQAAQAKERPAEFETTQETVLNGEVAKVRTAMAANDAVAAENDRIRKQAANVAGGPRPTRAEKRVARVANATRGGTVTEKKIRKNVAKGKTKPPETPKAQRPKRTRKERSKAARASRKKFVRKIPSKYKKTRAVATLALGGGWYGWRAAAKLGSGAKVTARTVAGQAKSTAQKRKWTPKPVGQKVFSGSYQCCDKKFSSADALNAHFLSVHTDGGPDAPETPMAGGATLQATNNRKNGTTVKVLLPPGHADKKGRRRGRAVPAGRHRAPESPDKRADRLVAAYRDKITSIGAKAMPGHGEARAVAQGFRAWGSIKPPKGRNWTLNELRELVATLEGALLVGGEAIQAMERTLTLPRDANGCAIDPAVTRPGMLLARDGLSTAALGLTRMLATFEDIYNPYIRAALPAPAIDMHRRTS